MEQNITDWQALYEYKLEDRNVEFKQILQLASFVDALEIAQNPRLQHLTWSEIKALTITSNLNLPEKLDIVGINLGEPSVITSKNQDLIWGREVRFLVNNSFLGTRVVTSYIKMEFIKGPKIGRRITAKLTTKEDANLKLLPPKIAQSIHKIFDFLDPDNVLQYGNHQILNPKVLRLNNPKIDYQNISDLVLVIAWLVSLNTKNISTNSDFALERLDLKLLESLISKINKNDRIIKFLGRSGKLVLVIAPNKEIEISFRDSNKPKIKINVPPEHSKRTVDTFGLIDILCGFFNSFRSKLISNTSTS